MGPKNSESSRLRARWQSLSPNRTRYRGWVRHDRLFFATLFVSKKQQLQKSNSRFPLVSCHIVTGGKEFYLFYPCFLFSI